MRFLLLCTTLLAAPAIALEPALTPEQSARYEGLLEELRCMVCQNQNLAESNAPLAEDLRREVREQVAQGRSEAEVKAYLTQRYGDYVLYRPPFKRSTWLLWLGPAGLLALALFVGWRVLRTRPAPPPPSDAETLRRILDEDEPR